MVARDGLYKLEQKVKACPNCQQHQSSPATVPLHLWERPKQRTQPWARVHIDYAAGKMLLINVDAHSKWIEAQVVSSATSQSTVVHMRTLFATHGLQVAPAYRTTFQLTNQNPTSAKYNLTYPAMLNLNN